MVKVIHVENMVAVEIVTDITKGRIMELIITIIVCLFAGLGAGLGTGFAGKCIYDNIDGYKIYLKTCKYN